MAKVVVTGKIPSGGLERLKAEHDVLLGKKTMRFLAASF
jgi:hypothetical protein